MDSNSHSAMKLSTDLGWLATSPSGLIILVIKMGRRRGYDMLLWASCKKNWIKIWCIKNGKSCENNYEGVPCTTAEKSTTCLMSLAWNMLPQMSLLTHFVVMWVVDAQQAANYTFLKHRVLGGNQHWDLKLVKAVNLQSVWLFLPTTH